MATWSLTAELPADDADACTALLFELGAAGVEEREAGLAPMPGERQPGAGRVLLIAFFADQDTARDAAAQLDVPSELVEIPDRDWGEEWKKGLGPVSVGRVFLRPSWIDAAPPPGAAEVVLDPGMAFGTGTHATTSLCLGAIDAFLARRPGASVTWSSPSPDFEWAYAHPPQVQPPQIKGLFVEKPNTPAPPDELKLADHYAFSRISRRSTGTTL